MRRPRSEIQSVVVHRKGRDNEWVPHRFEKNSWIKLSAPKRGKWAHDGDLKAVIKDFKFKPCSTVVESVLVQHAYSPRQLQLESKSPGHCNYLYLSKFEDWEDPLCISDVIRVLHAEIGELTRGPRTHKQLLEAEVFFYNAVYVPPSKTGKFGKLVPLPLPPLEDPSWPVPDMNTSEAFRARLFSDVQAAMKPKTGSRVCSIHWFIPFHVMIDLFSIQSGEGMHRTPTLFVWKPISDGLFDSLMDPGWDIKIVCNKDIVKCQVLCPSVVFRYHIGRETLYTRFGYVRERLVGKDWVKMDENEAIEMVSVEVELLDGSSMVFDVGQSWALSHLREELSFYMSRDVEDFTFMVLRPTKKNLKINKRQEKKMSIKDIGNENRLQIVAE